MTLKEQRNAYKSFFLSNEAGKEYLKQLRDIHERNIAKAQKDSSLDYLSRSAGNREALDLIENVLITEVEPKR